MGHPAGDNMKVNTRTLSGQRVRHPGVFNGDPSAILIG